MGHAITALLVKGNCNTAALEKYDLKSISLKFDLSLLFIDHYYSACWQKMTETTEDLPMDKPPPCFPTEGVLLEIAKALTNQLHPKFAIIQTDYFGGVGSQWAQVFHGPLNPAPEISSINEALRYLDVKRGPEGIWGPAYDEFDAVGLGNYRSNPEHLWKYIDLSEELGV